MEAPIALDLPRPCLLQDLISEWSTQTRGVNALAAPPRKLALQLQRYTAAGNKTSHPVVLLDSIAVPCFTNGVDVEQITYRVDSVVSHLGDQLNSGHYKAALRLPSAWYIADDNVKPMRDKTDLINTEAASNAYLIICSRL